MATLPTWAGGSSAELTTPTATDITNGFVCGPADPGLFNWLFNQITTCINSLETSLNTVIANLASTQAQVSQNTNDIAANTATLSTHTSQLASHASTLSTHTTDIAANAAAISALQSSGSYPGGMAQGTIV